MTTRSLLFSVLCMGVAATLAAQPPAATPSQFKLGQGTVDLAVPESPAFSALGMTPLQVARPTSGRELATSLLNGVDRDGNFQSGIAIDTAPYMLLAGSQITLRRYQEPSQYVTRFLARMQTSLATTKGASSSDPSTKLAMGFRFTVFDRGDPRTDKMLIECLQREGDKVLLDAPPLPPDTPPEQVAIANQRREEAVRANVKPCRDQAAKRRWNRSASIFGVAPTWTSPDGTVDQVKYSGTALWSSLGYGFEGVPGLQDYAMLAAYVKARNREVAPDQLKKGSFVVQNNVTAGARLLFGAPASQFNVEGLWVRNNRPDLLEDRYWNLNFGFDRKLVDNIWLNLSFGRQLARKEGVGGFVVLAAFNWGFGPR